MHHLLGKLAVAIGQDLVLVTGVSVLREPIIWKRVCAAGQRLLPDLTTGGCTNQNVNSCQLRAT